MANKMLIDATHPEETRVVVLKGDRVEEFDLENQEKRQLRGNIYLAKVTRVEPSLQAAFVDYGGNRHGFLAFSEIHPDYYQIPVADREALLAEVAAENASDDDDGDDKPEPVEATVTEAEPDEGGDESAADAADDAKDAKDVKPSGGDADSAAEAEASGDEPTESDAATGDDKSAEDDGEPAPRRPRRRRRSKTATAKSTGSKTVAAAARTASVSEEADENGASGDQVESVGAEDALEEVPDRRLARRRPYKIQEVIRRRQILLVQVVKEERGTKGAALTTYLSLAGRYCVLMPNTARGGGISRKITNPSDRRRLKTIASELKVPEGTGVIVRTAGAQRTKAEIKRDYEYLLRLWESIRDLTLKSTAPTLIYEEGSLVKRSIRDLYSKDIDEVLVEGEDGYREAKAFMRMLMPSHAKNIKQYKESQPLFMHHRVESQLDQMFSPVVTLKSGGYLVINQTEALVAVDVNSGKSTREHNIEDTALQTNLEAAAEVARQLRLRDLAGLIVIDFIDMEEKRNNRSVEKKLKDCLKTDRARIQVGRISHFGLMEMSRQRIRASVLEGTMEVCPHCQGAGRVRSVSSTALQIVRALEEQALGGSGRDLTIRTNTEIALYMLNNKRAHITDIEARFSIHIGVAVDATMLGSSYVIERGAVSTAGGTRAEAVIQIDSAYDNGEPVTAPAPPEAGGADGGDDAGGRKRRRRRRGRKRSDEDQAETVEATVDAETSGSGDSGDEESAKPKRRRGRRGGRRRRGEDGATAAGQPGEPIDWPWGQQDGDADTAQADVAAPAEAAPAASAAEESAADGDTPETASDAPVDVAPAEDVVPTADVADTADVPAATEEMDVAPEAGAPPADDTAEPVHPALNGQSGGMADTPALEETLATTRTAALETSGTEPAVTAEEDTGPRRKGWWQRRFLSSE